MSFNTFRPAAVLTVLALVMPAPALAERVGNFMLLDHRGKAHELYYHTDASAVVVMIQGNGLVCEKVSQ